MERRAHTNFNQATADLPAKLRGARPVGQPHTPQWLVECMQRKLVANPKIDPLARLLNGSGQTVARGAMLLVDHTAYHVAQLVMVHRLLGAWWE